MRWERQIMNKSLAVFLQDMGIVFRWLLPYAVVLPIAYCLGAAVSVSFDLMQWESGCRIVTLMGGLVYGFGLDMRLENERRM